MYKLATAALAVALGISLSAIPAMSADDNMTLKDKGHDPGPIDGIHGPRTSAPLRAYQKAENIKVTGRLDADTKSHLMGQASGGSTATTPSASPAAEKPSAAPSAGGSPSAAPAPPSKTQKP